MFNDYIINTIYKDVKCCFLKTFKDKPVNEIEKFDIIIVYCANFTCNVSLKYIEELKNIKDQNLFLLSLKEASLNGHYTVIHSQKQL